MIKSKFITEKYFKLAISLISLALLAILFLDKPVYEWSKNHLQRDTIHSLVSHGSSSLYDVLTSELSLVIFVGSILVIVTFGSRFALSKKILPVLIAYQALCLLVLNFIKGLLKYFFGRCVPDVCFLPWYIDQSNQYGFAWLSSVSGFASFPSGHCTFMSFCFFWVIALRSQLKLLIGVLFGLLFGGLVLFNYHFLGDCLAGSALGILFGGCSYWLWCSIIQSGKFNVILK